LENGDSGLAWKRRSSHPPVRGLSVRQGRNHKKNSSSHLSKSLEAAAAKWCASTSASGDDADTPRGQSCQSKGVRKSGRKSCLRAGFRARGPVTLSPNARVIWPTIAGIARPHRAAPLRTTPTTHYKCYTFWNHSYSGIVGSYRTVCGVP
jgi:hypothetical protein